MTSLKVVAKSRINGKELYVYCPGEDSEMLLVNIDSILDLQPGERNTFFNLFRKKGLDWLFVARLQRTEGYWHYILTDDEIEEARNIEHLSGIQQQMETIRVGRQYRPGYVYVLLADNNLYKIGRSSKINTRIKQLKTKLPYELVLISYIWAHDHVGLEEELHKEYANKRVRGEWFRLDKDDVEYLKELGEPWPIELEAGVY